MGVHISRARSLEQALEEGGATPAQTEDPDFEAALNKLLRLLRGHSDKRAAIAAATKTVLAVPPKPNFGSSDKYNPLLVSSLLRQSLGRICAV